MKKTEEQINKAIEVLNGEICDLRNLTIETSSLHIENMIRETEDFAGQYLGNDSVIKKVQCRPGVLDTNETVITFNHNNYNCIKLIQPEKYNRYDVPTWEFSVHSNYYSSTSGSGDAYSDSFELLTFFGVFAKKLQEESTSLIEYINDLYAAYKPEFESLYAKKGELQIEASNLKKAREERIQNEVLISLMSKDGLDMPSSRNDGRCGLSIKHGHTVYNVKNIKVLSLTKSKKSANIEVTNAYEIWDAAIEAYMPIISRQGFTTVRYANIEDFIDTVNGRDKYSEFAGVV